MKRSEVSAEGKALAEGRIMKINEKHKQMNRTKSDEWISVSPGGEQMGAGWGVWRAGRWRWRWQITMVIIAHPADTSSSPLTYLRTCVKSASSTGLENRSKHLRVDSLIPLIKKRSRCRHLWNEHVTNRPHAGPFNANFTGSHRKPLPL